MTVFQLLAVGFCLLMLAAACIEVVRDRKRRLVSLLWVALWAIAGTLVVFPDATTTVARALGISRGVDVVVYVTLLFLVASVFHFLLALRRIEGDLTTLTRELAILQASRPQDTGNKTE